MGRAQRIGRLKKSASLALEAMSFRRAQRWLLQPGSETKGAPLDVVEVLLVYPDLT